MSKFPILFLSRSDIQPLVGMSDILTYVEEAFSLYSKSESGANIAHFSPMVSFPTKIPNTDIDYRAGLMDRIPAACSTLGFGYWDNPVNYDMPSVFAFSYLSDVKHAKPLAFMECYYLGGMRTGAAGGVGSIAVAILSNSLSINDKKTLNKKEMITLKTELLKCEKPTICPLGNRVIINLKNIDLENYF